MRNLIALAIATTVAACGGTVATQTPTLEAGNVSVDFYGFPAPTSPMSAIINVYTDAAGTIPAAAPNDVTKTFLPCSPAIVVPPAVQPQNCWNTVTSAFQGATLNLTKPAVGNLYIRVDFYSDAAATVFDASSPVTIVAWTAAGAGSVKLAPKTTELPAGNGVVIGSVTASVGFTSMLTDQTDTFTVSGIVDNSSASATFTNAFAVAAASGKTCSASFAGSALSGGTAGDVCVVTFTATSSTGKVGTLVWTISVNADTTVSSGGAVPAPIINSITLTSNNAADAVCTLSRGAGWTGANTTCPRAFGLPVTALDPTNQYTAKSFFNDIAVNYDLGVTGISAWAQPSVTVYVACTNDLTDFPLYTTTPAPQVNPPQVAGQPKWKAISFNPGYIVSASPTSTIVATDAYWSEPGFTLTGTAPFTAASWTKNVTGTAVCTFNITVVNQGATDILNFYANLQ